MPAMDPIDLSPTDLAIVLHILRRYVPEREVVAFGSRAKWTTRPGSDLDLAVLGQTPLSAAVIAAMKDAFDESSLTFAVDIVDWAATKESFRKIIHRDQVLIKPAEAVASRDDWHELTIGDLADVFDGPHATPPKVDAGPIFLGISNLVNGRLDLTEVEHISSEDYERWTKRVKPRARDVVFSYETRLGEAARIPEGLKCCLGRRMGLLRAKPDQVDPRFLLYAFLGPAFQDTIRSRTIHGSTVDRIPLVDFPRFPIRIPKRMSDQRRIAEILGALDDKIELNRRMNETLEAIAEALFDELLAHSTRGWEERPLGDYVSLQRGKTYNSSLKGLPGPYLLGLGSIRRNGGFRDEMLETYGGDSPDSLLLRPGDIYVSLKDVTQSGDLLGAVARMPASVAVGRLTQDTVMLVPISADAPMEIIYRTLLSDSYREYCRAHATGTTNLGLSRDDFLAYPIVCPPRDLRVTFDEQVRALNRRMELADHESDTLAQLRDALLPKLLSGEIRVATAEKELTEHV